MLTKHFKMLLNDMDFLVLTPMLVIIENYLRKCSLIMKLIKLFGQLCKQKRADIISHGLVQYSRVANRRGVVINGGSEIFSIFNKLGGLNKREGRKPTLKTEKFTFIYSKTIIDKGSR